MGGREPAQIIVRDAAGTVLWVGAANSKPGHRPPSAQLRLCVPPPYTVTLARIPAGYVSCPNRPPERILSAADFGPDRRAVIQYTYWRGCSGLPT